LKLDEATFFLEHAETKQDDVKIFGFYINAFFAAATSIRVGDGVMVNEYQRIRGFNNWYNKAKQNLEVKFPYEFWVKKTRNRVIHLTGNLQDHIRRKVTSSLTLETKEDGSMSIYRNDPPDDPRLRFAKKFDKKEGGNVIIDRGKEYLAALTQMIDEWENKLPT
jgi:hypothetical protein